MYDLAEMYEFVRSQEMYDLAAAVAIGFNDPEKVKTLVPHGPPSDLNMEDLPAMLRIPSKSG